MAIFACHINCAYKYAGAFYPKCINIYDIIYVLILSFFCFCIFQNKSYSQTLPDGTLGWCGINNPDYSCSYFGSADGACSAMKAFFNPNATYRGTKFNEDGVNAVCDWCGYNSQGVGCYGVGSTPTYFSCKSGYTKVAPGRCISNQEPYFESNSCQDSGGQVTPQTGHPVSIMTGTKIFSYNDFVLAGSPVNLKRVYINRRSYDTVFRENIGIGKDWFYDFQYEIVVTQTSAQNNIISLYIPGSTAIDFVHNSDGTFTPIRGGSSIAKIPSKANYIIKYLGNWSADTSNLYKTSNKWQVYLPDGTIYIIEGVNTNYSNISTPDYSVSRPTSRTNSAGRRTVFGYGSLGELTSLGDDFGNTISFEWTYNSIPRDSLSDTYTVPGSISTAMLPDGSKINYNYSSSTSDFPSKTDKLVKMERKTSNNNIIDAQIYSFDDTRFPQYITKIIDMRGVVVNNILYDAIGRVTKSSIAGDFDGSSINYGALQNNTITRTLTNALGKQTTYVFQQSSSGEEFVLSNINGIASTNCVESNSTYAYTNDFVSSMIDEEGRKTTYSRDTRGRPTTITRGSP